MDLNPIKLHNLVADIYENYYRGTRLIDVLDHVYVHQTNGEFVNVGIRTLLDRVQFIDPSSFLIGGRLGYSVLSGEINYALKKIQERVMTDEIQLDNIDDRINEIITEEYHNYIILANHKTLWEYFMKKTSPYHIRFTPKANKYYLMYEKYAIQLNFFNFEDIKIDLIILDRNAIEVYYLLYPMSNYLLQETGYEFYNNKYTNIEHMMNGFENNTINIQLIEYEKDHSKLDLTINSSINIFIKPTGRIKSYAIIE